MAGQVAVSFMAHRIWGHERAMPKGEVMIVHDDRDMTGAVLFNNFDQHAGTIEMTAAATSKRWLTRAVLLEMFSFPFEQLRCQAAILRCDPADKALSRILTAYGFKRYDIPRLRGRNKAEAIFVLGDDDWRANKFNRAMDARRANGFHKEKMHGKIIPSAHAAA